MQTHFAFGHIGLTLDLPEGRIYHLIESRSARPLADPIAAIHHALEIPLAGPSLRTLATGKHSAAISVCDITRPAPNRLTLPPILERLQQAGIPAERTTILIATGLHRAATPVELDTILGPEIASTYRIVNHDARDLSAHRHLGSTRRGTPIYIDEQFMAADLHITLGFIEQHLMLGFSGGRKLIAPGLAAEATIKTIHSPRFMREALATEGSYDENPLHAELLEIASVARHDFLLDVTLTRSPETHAQEISGVFAGSPVEAHAAGVDFLRRTSLESVPALADLVITSAAGHPLDLTFYQAIKGITAAQHLVTPGGRILVLGECREGAGSPEFTRRLRSYAGHEAFLAEIASAPVEIDQWQLEKLALTGLKHDLFLYTPGVSCSDLGALGSLCFDTPEAALDAALHGLRPDARIALLPEGPYVFARVPERIPDRPTAVLPLADRT